MPTILVAEDSRLSRKLVVNPLIEKGFEILQAKNGKEALEIFQENESRISCVVSDNLMPEMSGVELLTAIRKFNTTTPVIMASADVQRTTREECEKLGIVAFLNKPIQAEELLKHIESAITEMSEA